MKYNKFDLIAAAVAARQNAYAPYSQFAVGAALLTGNGQIFAGCNVENISYGLTLCAERGAVMHAFAAGQRILVAIAIVADTDVPLSPCGACRQFLAEFAPDLPIVSATLHGAEAELSLTNLLPHAKTGILNQSQDIPQDHPFGSRAGSLPLLCGHTGPAISGRNMDREGSYEPEVFCPLSWNPAAPLPLAHRTDRPTSRRPYGFHAENRVGPGVRMGTGRVKRRR